MWTAALVVSGDTPLHWRRPAKRKMTDYLTWIENHQTLTVGIIGFLGVIATLWYNARQAGIQRRKELFHERQTLRVALAEELIINRGTFVKSIKSLDANTALDKGKGAEANWVPTYEMVDVYRSFINRIGLLSQPEVRKVMYAYLTLRAYTAALLLHSRAPETGDLLRHVLVPSHVGLSEMQKASSIRLRKPSMPLNALEIRMG